MCSPEIVRLAHESAPQPSRRALLGLAGLTALAAVAPAPAVAAPRSGVVDLTHTLTPHLPVWPGNPPLVMVPVATHASGGFGQFALGYWEHTGTHLDAPAHRIPGAATTDALVVDDLVAPLVVIDISAKAAVDADAVVTVADIDNWRSQHGDLPERAFVAMYSGWERRIDRPSTFLNLDERGTPTHRGSPPTPRNTLSRAAESSAPVSIRSAWIAVPIPNTVRTQPFSVPVATAWRCSPTSPRSRRRARRSSSAHRNTRAAPADRVGCSRSRECHHQSGRPIESRCWKTFLGSTAALTRSSRR